MIDLKCGASSLKHMCSDGKGDFFCLRRKRKSVSCRILHCKYRHIFRQPIWCDASHVPKQLFESDYETYPKALFLYL